MRRRLPERARPEIRQRPYFPQYKNKLRISDLWESFWTFINFLMYIIKSRNETKSQNAHMDKANSKRQKSFY